MFSCTWSQQKSQNVQFVNLADHLSKREQKDICKMSPAWVHLHGQTPDFHPSFSGWCRVFLVSTQKSGIGQNASVQTLVCLALNAQNVSNRIAHKTLVMLLPWNKELFLLFVFQWFMSSFGNNGQDHLLVVMSLLFSGKASAGILVWRMCAYTTKGKRNVSFQQEIFMVGRA